MSSERFPQEESLDSEPQNKNVPPPTVDILDAIAAQQNLQLSQVSPMYGLQMQTGPQYLRYNMRGRSWHERMFHNAGICYMGGA